MHYYPYIHCSYFNRIRSLLIVLGNFAGAGSFIPITGFSNAMTSSALEARTEGLVTGIGANIFKLGGAVITFGIVASFIVGGLRYVITYFW